MESKEEVTKDQFVELFKKLISHPKAKLEFKPIAFSGIGFGWMVSSLRINDTLMVVTLERNPSQYRIYESVRGVTTEFELTPIEGEMLGEAWKIKYNGEKESIQFLNQAFK